MVPAEVKGEDERRSKRVERTLAVNIFLRFSVEKRELSITGHIEEARVVVIAQEKQGASLSLGVSRLASLMRSP